MQFIERIKQYHRNLPIQTRIHLVYLLTKVRIQLCLGLKDS